MELRRLSVPERHAEPDGRTIEIAFAVLPCTGKTPGAPIVFLEGGPGVSGIDGLLRYAWPDVEPMLLGLRALGDVILLDQRGIGRSRPGTDVDVLWDVPLGEPGEREPLVELARERSREALERIADGDIAAFTAAESADDVDHVRRALGAERLRLFGWSYGSHLSLAVLRRHGERIERAVLGLVEGPDHTHKLPSAIDAHLRHVGELVGEDLLAQAADVRDRLAAHPETVETEAGRVVLGPFDLQRTVSERVGSARSLRRLPERLRALRAGDFGWLAADKLAFARASLGNAGGWHTDIASGASAPRRERILAERDTTVLGDAINFPFPDVEDTWGSPDLGDEFRGSLHSDVPVLFFSGSLDGRTPPANVDEVIGGFPNAVHVRVEGVSHDIHTDGPWSPEILEELHVPFLAGEPPRRERIVVPFYAPSASSTNASWRACSRLRSSGREAP